ncbi:Uncharacterised protein [Mycobacteroides abscessus subsp. abscessus]|nr:Uncharacterised protein [Mycobacteroides abscessus subsp. abscessus]
MLRPSVLTMPRTAITMLKASRPYNSAMVWARLCNIWSVYSATSITATSGMSATAWSRAARAAALSTPGLR